MQKLTFLSLLMLASAAFAQRSGITYLEELRTGERAPTKSLEALNYANLAAEDALNDVKGGKFRFAVGRDVNLGVADGDWSELSPGTSLWQYKFEAPGAVHLNFGFSRLTLPAGAELLIINGDGKEALGPYTSADIAVHKQFWTPVLAGNAALLRIQLPTAKRSQLELELIRVGQGYRGFGKNMNLCKSGACNLDVACLGSSDAWNRPRRSVGAYTVGGTDTCTGSLVNNTANDRRMLFATARHCGVISDANAQSALVYWNYESPTCRTPGSPESGTALPKPATTSAGVRFLATTNNPFAGADPAATRSDWTIFELATPPAGNSFNLHWAGWDRSPPPTQCAPVSPGSTQGRCASIHHPAVDEKRITFVATEMILDNIEGAAGVHWQANWDVSPPVLPGIAGSPATIVPGVTERGSSGSPLYNANQRLIGVLSGGPSACGATGASLRDQYGGLFHAWEGNGTPATRMKDILDPSNSGVTFINGIDNCNAPSAPNGAAATASANNQVTVTWGAVGGAQNYSVFRALGSCAMATAFSPLAQSITGTSYVDSAVSGGSTYAYKITAVDTAQPCESVQSTCIEAQATGACTLAPAFAGATGAQTSNLASCTNVVSWNAASSQCGGSSVGYNVFRATAATFTPSASNRIATNVSGASFTDSTGLVSGTPYFYTVRAVDSTNTQEETNTIVRRAVPAGILTTSNFVETFEAATGFDREGWTTQSLSGANVWVWSTAQAQSPTHSWHSPSQAAAANRVLVSPSVGITNATTLSFWHTYNFEFGSGGQCYDGGTLEISTNAGTTWTVVPDSAFTAGGFTGAISATSNPISTKRAWCGGTIGAMTQVNVDLGSFAGQSALLRWHAGDDLSIARTGWFVDSVTINNAGVAGACTTGNPDAYFINGFE
jgi:lysyl endopeptidase